MPHFDIIADLIGVLWICGALFWLVSAFNRKKTIYRQPFRQRLAYIIPSVAGVLIVRVIPNVFTPLIPVSFPLQVAGMALCLAGMVFAVWARAVLGNNWSGIVTFKQDHELIQHGPYRLVRHPIYSGILLAILGTLLALMPTIAAVFYLLVVALAFTIKLKQEEKLLTAQFPDAYPAYKQKVRTAFVPFIY